MDMYEHAYHMDDGAAAARYIDAFLVNVQWGEVNRRLEQAHRLHRVFGISERSEGSGADA
jgi:Fe-Mn family superoxide dismutase